MKKINYTKWVNAGAGIYKVNFNNDYPEFVEVMDHIHTREDFKNVFGVICNNVAMTKVDSLIEVGNYSMQYFYDLDSRTLYITCPGFDAPELFDLELVIE